MGIVTPVWPYFTVICIILTLIAWVEDIKRFSITFLVGNLLIMLTIITVSIYCVFQISANGPGPNLVAYDPSGFWATVGFAIYSYEGIGIVMPVLSRARDPQEFTKCLVAAISTLSVIFIFFGEITSWTWGSNLTEPFVTQMLPS